MARKPRVDVGHEIYHVINRANGRLKIFWSHDDYQYFENLLFEKLQGEGVVCSAFVIMPNHWHLLLKTYEDGSLSRLMRQISQIHTQHFHIQRRNIGSGHLYQGRFKSHLIDSDNYFLAAIKYIERNPVAAKLCNRVEDWRWSSAYHRNNHTTRVLHLDADLLLPLPKDYTKWVNTLSNPTEVEDVRRHMFSS